MIQAIIQLPHFPPNFRQPEFAFIVNAQLSLDFFEESRYPRFDELLGHANAELIYFLQQAHDQFIYIWGEKGAGKSHILQAWVGQAMQAGHRAVYLDATKTSLSNSLVDDADYVAIDQIEKLRSKEQSVLFNLFNRFRNQRHGHLLLASDFHPAKLNLREDLRTRVAYCLSYEVQPLNREEKIHALHQLAQTRQLHIDPKIYGHLHDHWRQDMSSLFSIFNDLVSYSVTTGKPLTLHLVKQLLKQQEFS